LQYSGAIVALRVDEVEMPGGRTAKREVVEHHGAVAIAAVNDRGEVALVLQYRHPLGRRLLELPAGLLDAGPDESPLEAAQRELLEETGLAADHWSVLVDVAVSPGFTDEALRVFLATGISEVPQPDPEDEEADMTVHWFTVDDAVHKVFSGEIVNSTAVSGILSLAASRAGSFPLRDADAPWPDRPTAFALRKAAQA
jgi:ADP-ribose pyrophosphatase